MNLRQFKKSMQKHSISGMSLIEVLISMSVLSIGAVVFSSQSGNLNQSYRATKAIYVYREIASDVGDASSDVNVVLSSLKRAGVPAVLSQCLSGTIDDPKDCTHNIKIGFSLYRPGTNELIAGPNAANPAYFDTNGKTCTHTDKTLCTVRAYAEASPMCFDSTPTCFAAHTIAVSYHVEAIPTSPFWITSNILPDNIEGEAHMETDLIPLLEYVKVLACAGRTAITGISFSLKTICTTIPSPTRGPKGPVGIAGTAGGTGPRGPNR